LRKFTKYEMWILSVVGCVRPDNFTKNRFSLSDAPTQSVIPKTENDAISFIHMMAGFTLPKS